MSAVSELTDRDTEVADRPDAVAGVAADHVQPDVESMVLRQKSTVTAVPLAVTVPFRVAEFLVTLVAASACTVGEPSGAVKSTYVELVTLSALRVARTQYR